MIHPYLIDPERAQAFAYLVANPWGSRVRWAQALRWNPSKLQRFIDALVRFRLAEIEVTAGCPTHFKSLIDPPISSRSGSDPTPIKNRSAADQPYPEASRSGSSVSRCGNKPQQNSGNAEAMTCIATVNEVLLANFGANYEPIRPDNFGSHRAVVAWIQAGMSLEDMTRLLRQKAAAFNPEKSGGELPRSLGYFTKWMLKEWAIERRQIPLPLMTVSQQPVRREAMKKPIALGEVLKTMEAK